MSETITPKFAARILAAQALYQLETNGEVRAEPTIGEYLGPQQKDRLATIGAKAMDQGLFTALVNGAFAESEALDDMILGVLSQDWTLERLDPVLKALLRAATHELAQVDQDAPRRLIAQYVQIAQGFFGGKEPGLVNATLDALAHALHPEAFEGAFDKSFEEGADG